MHTLERHVEVLANSEASSIRLRNLQLIIDAHQVAPYVHDIDADDLPDIFRNQSSTPDPATGTEVNRSTREILRPYGLSIQALLQFAHNGIVLDVGSGTSDFLSAFPDNIETIAVDTKEEYIETQKSRHHCAVNEPAHDMPSIQNGSIALLNANYSVPLWSANPDEAIQTFREQLRVLALGGIGLVNPLIRDDLRDEWEWDLTRMTDTEIFRLSTFTGESDLISHTAVAFSQEVIKARQLHRIKLALLRSESFRPGSNRPPHISRQVPDLMIYQKIA